MTNKKQIFVFYLIFILIILFLTNFVINTKKGLIDDIFVINFFENQNKNFFFSYIYNLFFTPTNLGHTIAPRFFPLFDLRNYFSITLLALPFQLIGIQNLLFKVLSFIFCLKILKENNSNDYKIFLSFLLIFWAFPNTPETRTFTQENLQFLFLIVSYFYYSKSPKFLSLDYWIFFIMFVCLSFSKETSIVFTSIFILYLFINRGIKYSLFFLIIYFFTLYKILVIMSIGQGYQISSNHSITYKFFLIFYLLSEIC